METNPEPPESLHDEVARLDAALRDLRERTRRVEAGAWRNTTIAIGVLLGMGLVLRSAPSS